MRPPKLVIKSFHEVIACRKCGQNVLSAALASISSDEAESFGSEEQGSAAARRGASTVPRGNAARHLSPAPQAPASAPPALRPAMSDPIERPQASGLRRRKSTRISDADAATAAAALAGAPGQPEYVCQQKAPLTSALSSQHLRAVVRHAPHLAASLLYGCMQHASHEMHLFFLFVPVCRKAHH